MKLGVQGKRGKIVLDVDGQGGWEVLNLLDHFHGRRMYIVPMSCFMRYSGGVLLKMQKYFEVMLKIFKSPEVGKEVFINLRFIFLDCNNKTNLLPASFLKSL